MSENKLDRTNLKRQAQRVESYSMLVSKRRSVFKDDTMNIGKLRSENTIEGSHRITSFTSEINEYEEENKKKCYNEECSSSPPSENRSSSSSDSSQEGHQSLYRKWRAAKNKSKECEDASPVMTRSATRKYTSVGAIYNRVDFEHELKIERRWPVSVCSSPPTLPGDNIQLKNLVTRSLNYVMSFCKYATLTKSKEPEKKDNFDFKKSVNFADLSPYLSHVTENGDQQTQVKLHFDESVLSHQFINVITINSNEEESRALINQKAETELDTITLHSGETYVLDNKTVPNYNSVFVNLTETRASSGILSVSSKDPMMAVYNDHTYAMRHTENKCVAEPQSNEAQASLKQDKSELILQNALKDLLLNTAILKCLICGKAPQEMIELLDRAHRNEGCF